ncbi:lysophospholipid acyltransferase family protein [bacterium]|nr:lysophospholipid acyltransferase family protein [candidate division CSSED10-310 bacterium]
MLTRESLKRDIARLFIWYPVRWFFRILPVKTSIKLLYLMGEMHFKLFKNTLRHIEKNIKMGLPDIREEGLQSVLRSYLRNHYFDRLHIFLYPRFIRNIKHVDSLIEFSGLNHLDHALSAGKGVILTLGHYGPIQLPLFGLGSKGYSIIQIGLPVDEGFSWIGRNVAFRLRMKYEGMIPAKIFPADKFLRPIFTQLKDNGAVMVTIDPAGGGKWLGKIIRFPFLGGSIPFPVGPASLSVKTGAPLLPVSVHRKLEGKYNCEIHPPLSCNTDNPLEITAYLVRWYEDQVAIDPGLWHFWDEFESGKLLPASDLS